MGFDGTVIAIQSDDIQSTDALLIATTDKYLLNGVYRHGTFLGWVWYTVDIPERSALMWARDLSRIGAREVVLCPIVDSAGYEGAFSFRNGSAVAALASEFQPHLPANETDGDPVGKVFQDHGSADVTRAWITDVLMLDAESETVFSRERSKPRRKWWPFG